MNADRGYNESPSSGQRHFHASDSKIDYCTHNEILLKKVLPFIAHIAEGQHDTVYAEQDQIGADDKGHRHNGENRLEQHQSS